MEFSQKEFFSSLGDRRRHKLAARRQRGRPLPSPNRLEARASFCRRRGNQAQKVPIFLPALDLPAVIGSTLATFLACIWGGAGVSPAVTCRAKRGTFPAETMVDPLYILGKGDKIRDSPLALNEQDALHKFFMKDFGRTYAPCTPHL